MKKILAIILSIIISVLCCACGSSKPTIEGEWYHTETGYKYNFNKGNILCEEKDTYFTLSNGKKLSGFYKEFDEHYEAYIRNICGMPKYPQKIYLIKIDNDYSITTKPTNKGEILFCKSKDKALELKNVLESKKKQEILNAQKKLLDNYISMKPVTYESILRKQHTKKIIAIEAIIDSIKYDDFPEHESYEFDIYYWSQNHQTYVVDKNTRIYLKDVPSHVVKILPTLKNGDKLKIVTQVYKDDSFGTMDTKYIEILSRDNIIDKSKKYLEKSTYNANTYKKFDNKSYNVGKTTDIKITYAKDYIDGNKMYLKVYVKNNSSAMFKGDVHVFFYSADGKKRLGSDMIIVDKLMPGQTSWAKVKIDKYFGTPKIETEFTNPQFLDVSPISTEIDTTLTEKTSNSVRLNFDVASWYKNIESIKVMTDRTCIVTSSSHKDNSIIASAVWSCGKDHGIKTVQVIDTDGNIKAVYP